MGPITVVPTRAIEDKDLGHAAFRVLACIAAHADKAGWCWPSAGAIAERLGLSRSSVMEHVGALERLGHIEISRRVRPDGGSAANGYRIVGRETAETDAGPLSAHPTPPVGNSDTPLSAGPDTPLSDLPDTVKNIPIKNRLSRPIASDRESEAANQFEIFWRIYPSRRPHPNPKKPARLKFVAAVKHGADPAAILAGAKAYAATMAASDTAPRFVAQAVTWLGQERWNDDYQPTEDRPRAGMC